MKNALATSLTLALIAASVTLVPRAFAQEGEAPHRSFGLGFHSASAPIGGRWWVAPNWGVDLGFTVGADRVSTVADTDLDGFPDQDIEDTLAHWGVEAGMPWTLWRWGGVRTNLRPGLGFFTEDDVTTFVDIGARRKRNTIQASAHLEVELFIGRNISLSAAQGIEFSHSSLDVPDAADQWSIETVGSDFATLGFHVYLFGPEVK